MNRSIILLAGLSAAGLLTGFAAKRVSHRETTAKAQALANQRARSSSPSQADERPPSLSRSALPELPALHSTDTVESLLAIPDNALYGRLAVWMMDASEEDIAAYWKGYSQKEKRSNDINKLVFINWTRLNPQAAIAGAGGNNVHYAWWAWACHDPEASLAAAIATNKDSVNNVTLGIGEFHPAWLREHFQEIPESGRSNAIKGMKKRIDSQNPLESLRFMKQNGIASTGTLKALVRQDPSAALEWVKENPRLTNSQFSRDDSMDFVINTMAVEDLERLVAQTPSGMLKLKMESALFGNLLKTDPDAALEKARTAPAPGIAAERYAAIGLGVVESDPDAAFQHAKDLFAACPDATYMVTGIKTPDSSSGDRTEVPGVSEFLQTLSAKDPVRAMELTLDLPTGNGSGAAFDLLSEPWLKRDPVAYTEWLNRQVDGEQRERGAGLIASKLQDDGCFQEAAEWVMSMKKPEWDTSRLLNRWSRADPNAASEWLENSSFTADQKKTLRRNLRGR